MQLSVDPIKRSSELPTGANLFSPLRIKEVTFRNRIVVSPMCQYSCEDGFATNWHLVHLGSRAVGGAGLVIVEATAIEPFGRISAQDLGLWKDAQIEKLNEIAQFIKAQGAAAGIQIGHAGRKASTQAPWVGHSYVPPSEGGWQPVAPSAIPFRISDPAPAELTRSQIKDLVNAFAATAERALRAGFEVLELHGAHGYLIHEFLSPLSNTRTDEYGGSFDNRIRFLLEATERVRQVWPNNLPLFVRLSATDWVEGGWTLQESADLSLRLKQLGVDLIDCSSGGTVPNAKIPSHPGYQVEFAAEVRQRAEILTGAVGLITDANHANQIVEDGKADLVLLARELLRDPYWPLHAARKLQAKVPVPDQYARAF
jgi:2,4-dienoyl-CoA reductase-like NADH-dependent reductase (Old Yellow Enzyme family)